MVSAKVGAQRGDAVHTWPTAERRKEEDMYAYDFMIYRSALEEGS